MSSQSNARENRGALVYIRTFHMGEENTISEPELAQRLGVTDQELGAVINLLQKIGHPICGSVDGYFYAKHSKELDQTIEQLAGSLQQTDLTMRGLIKARERLSAAEKQ